ncbi:LRC43 protein, partial [Ptilorrhoa leucosticta]|nr:LRC43 protein [Ptilorrhoa leucosticta]
PGSVSAAFQEYLRHLGLQDFPCGLGSWNKSCLNACRSPRAEPVGLEEAVPPGEETPEALLELLRDQHSPWALPPDCSPQDRLLWEVAVLAPDLLRGSRVFQVVKSLRILDKGVEEVDEGLLRFQQLEELILSANHISRVTSAHLPQTLKVLELCCNTVGDLQDLCARPPPELHHLGLGYNRLCGPSQEKHLTVDFWWPLLGYKSQPFRRVVSLHCVHSLCRAVCLCCPFAQGGTEGCQEVGRGTWRFLLALFLPQSGGNVLQLHGKVVFLSELIRNEARVVVSIGEMKGLPDPKAFQQLKAGSEGPVITYSYCVTYEF